MPEFRYIGFQDEVHSASLQDLQNNTWLIYPTQRSCREARWQFQKQWSFGNHRLLSMEEFKAELIWGEEICLLEDKRLLCLYQAMSEQQRHIFHLGGFDDIVDWGRHFFDFFEELSEEMVDAEELWSEIDRQGVDLQEWQKDKLQQLLEVRNRYREYLTAQGYGDKIFDNKIENFHPPAKIRNFRFANQHYYTALEKQIIQRLENLGKKVTVIFQIPQHCVDEAQLKVRDFEIEDVFPEGIIPFEFSIMESNSQWLMVLDFLGRFAEGRKASEDIEEQSADRDRHLVIDAEFYQASYATAFSGRHFNLAQQESIVQTWLYHFLNILLGGLKSITYDNHEKLLKLDWLLQAVALPDFVKYFVPELNAAGKEILLTDISKLAAEDIQYLDLQLRILSMAGFPSLSVQTQQFLQMLTGFLLRLCSVSDISEFIAIFGKDGIDLSILLRNDEKESSNLEEVFYKGLANFNAIDGLGLVKEWQAIYPEVLICCGILELFLQFLKPLKYNYLREREQNTKPVITNLMDTRNLSAEKLTFLNLNEGEIPSQRSAVWLLNEKQRNQLGLKTWEDIRRRERYYFFRLLASAREVSFCFIKNHELNIEASSFLTEFYLFWQKYHPSAEDKWQKTSASPSAYLVNLLSEESGKSELAKEPDIQDLSGGRFFNLPFEPREDFGEDKQIHLSWTACSHLLKNPFLYYLQDIAKLEERIIRIEDTINRKLFGLILHHYLMTISQKIAENDKGSVLLNRELVSSAFLGNCLAQVLADELLHYKIPRNYNRQYLMEVMRPYLIQSADWFFNQILGRESNLQQTQITIIPERTDESAKDEKRYKLLVPPSEQTGMYSISIRGRADLRLQTRDTNYIIDFKTGNYNKMQLIFYQLYYYLLEQKDLSSEIRCGFYKLMEKQMDWLRLTKNYSPDSFVQKLDSALKTVLNEGFVPGKAGYELSRYADVIRLDLYGKVNDEEEE